MTSDAKMILDFLDFIFIFSFQRAISAGKRSWRPSRQVAPCKLGSSQSCSGEIPQSGSSADVWMASRMPDAWTSSGREEPRLLRYVNIWQNQPPLTFPLSLTRSYWCWNIWIWQLERSRSSSGDILRSVPLLYLKLDLMVSFPDMKRLFARFFLLKFL